MTNTVQCDVAAALNTEGNREGKPAWGKVLGRARMSVASSRPARSSTYSRCLRPSRP